MSEEEDFDEMAQTLFFLGMKKTVSYELGCSRHVRILKKPIPQTPDYCPTFFDYIAEKPVDSSKLGYIGNYTLTNNDICYNHLQCRNRFCLKGNYLFEGSGSSLHIIEDPVTEENWRHVSPSISTRCTCTGISINPAISFGVAMTTRSPVLFGLTHNPVSRFIGTSFLDGFDARVCDGNVNNMMEGESIFVTNHGQVFLFDKERLVATVSDEMDETEYNEAAVSFAFHPRIAVASFSESLHVFDFRTDRDSMRCEIPGVSSIMSIDANQIAGASNKGVYLIDMRFPTQIGTYFEYFFTAPPMSLTKQVIGDFTCVIAHSPKSSEAVFFPFTRFEFGAPIRPFDAAFQEYQTLEKEYMTGIATNDNVAFLQFEKGGVVGLEMTRDLPPCRHFFTSLIREETEVPKDMFDFRPSFERITTRDDKPSPNWNTLFPQMTDHPPSELLKNPPEVEEPEDSGTTGYLMEVEGALELDNEDVPTALTMFWKNHLGIIRSNI